MGRHGVPERRERPLLLMCSMVLVVAAVGLGWWWWTLRSGSDPVDAAPVDGYAVVVSSSSCAGAGSDTVVDLVATIPQVRTTVNACGLASGQRIAVQYLSGRPDVARVAGTHIAGRSTGSRWLPIGILAAGALAIGATLVLLRDRRRSKRIQEAQRISVADLRQVLSNEQGVERSDIDVAGATVITGNRTVFPSDGMSGELFTHRPEEPSDTEGAADRADPAARRLLD